MPNVFLQAINVARIPENNDLMHFIVVTGKDEPLVNSNVHVAEVPIWTVGVLIAELLDVIERPSLLNTNRTPVVIDATEDSWTIYNIVDENKKFNAAATIERLVSNLS